MGSHQNRTLDRGLDILLLFDDNISALTISDMVRKLHIPRSTVYRFVQILKQKGLLESIGHGFYQPGWLSLELTRVVSLRSELSELSLPIMQMISEKTKETVVMTIPFGLKAKVLVHVESPQKLQLSYKTGQERPLHKGAPSKIILANLDMNYQQYVLSKLGENWDTTSLKKELALIRDQGYVVTSNEVDEGARGIAAPIFRSNGTLVAGINVAGPLSRIDHKKLPEIIHSVKNAAEELTRILEVN